jgi:putative hydrolase of the HAD superfamily
VKQAKPQYGLFDLDDTIYPNSAGVMRVVSQRIDQYMSLRLGMNTALINELRPRYWEQYGTTMRGLVVDFGIDPDSYLSYVHDFSVATLLTPNRGLGEVLAQLPWRKVVFTNAPKQHAEEVLAALDVERHCERIFDVRETGYVGKPDASSYRIVLDSLGAGAQQCIALDDSIANLRTAKELGMITVLVGSAERADGADIAVNSIEQLAEVEEEITRLHCGLDNLSHDT